MSDSNDIVARLRLRPTILRKNQFGDMETDRAATELFNGCHSMMREAAAEIERLRDERAARIDELVRNTYEFRETLTDLRREVETLTAERDEARREVCNLMHQTGFLNGDYARERGWDCFKEARDDR